MKAAVIAGGDIPKEMPQNCSERPSSTSQSKSRNETSQRSWTLDTQDFPRVARHIRDKERVQRLQRGQHLYGSGARVCQNRTRGRREVRPGPAQLS
jgi:hypothetical protein